MVKNESPIVIAVPTPEAIAAIKRGKATPPDATVAPAAKTIAEYVPIIAIASPKTLVAIFKI